MLRRTRLLFVGDSVTAGFGLVPAGSFSPAAYPQLVAARLAERGLEVDVVVDALDGADSAYVLKRFDRMVTAHDPDWVVVALGLNDARPPKNAAGPLSGAVRSARSPAEFAGNLLAIVDRLLSIGARPVLQTPTPRFDTAGGSTDRGGLMAPYVAAVRDLAAQLRLPLIDVYQPLLAEPDLADLIPDGVHAGKQGHALIADVVTEELLALLGRPAPGASAAASTTIGPPTSNRKASR
jgi:lysophospholipase L1-like esterase